MNIHRGHTRMCSVFTNAQRSVHYLEVADRGAAQVHGWWSARALPGPDRCAATTSGEGARTAVINAVLELAQQDGEPFVLVYSYPHYYPRFGYTLAADGGITADWATHKPALPIRVLDDATPPTGEVQLPEAYGV